MAADHKPIIGFTQHTLESIYDITSLIMGRVPKRGRIAFGLRAIFSDNLRHALTVRYPRSRNLARSLYEDRGIPMENTNRWLRRGGAPSFDQLDELAVALGMRPFQLLMPGLDLLGEDPGLRKPTEGRRAVQRPLSTN